MNSKKIPTKDEKKPAQERAIAQSDKMVRVRDSLSVLRIPNPTYMKKPELRKYLMETRAPGRRDLLIDKDRLLAYQLMIADLLTAKETRAKLRKSATWLRDKTTTRQNLGEQFLFGIKFYSAEKVQAWLTLYGTGTPPKKAFA